MDVIKKVILIRLQLKQSRRQVRRSICRLSTSALSIPVMLLPIQKQQNGTADSQWARMPYHSRRILLLPLYMKEESERELAMFMDMVLLGRCDELWVFGGEASAGMCAEIAKAKRHGKKIRYFVVV